jgi:GntR family transcriptional regulator
MIIYGHPVIDHEAGQPPWMQLAAILRGRIERGELSGRLPSEKTLSQEYGLAIGTVRKAIAALRKEGLVGTMRGWGTFTTTTDDKAPPPGRATGHHQDEN